MAKNGKRLGFLPDWRIFTYFILIMNIVFLIWIIAGANSSTSKKDCGTLSAQACHDATNVGKGIGIALVIGLWVAFDVIFGIIWLITNRKKRDCPVCGHSVKKGRVQCGNCGHDFRQQYAPAGAPQQYSPQGYPQGPQPQYGWNQQQGPQGGQQPPRRPGPGPR